MTGREHMCEWRIERESAERAHSDQQLTPFNERENSNCCNSYVYRATRARRAAAFIVALCRFLFRRASAHYNFN